MIACPAKQKARPVRQDRAGFFVRESGSPPRGRRQMPSAYWRRPAAPCGNCRCPGLRPGAPPGGRRCFQKAEGQGSRPRRRPAPTVANTRTAPTAYSPCRLTRDIRPLPPVHAPDPRPIGDEILRTGEQHRRSAAPGQVHGGIPPGFPAGGQRAIHPLFLPIRPQQGPRGPPPDSTRRMDGVNRSSSARKKPHKASPHSFHG